MTYGYDNDGEVEAEYGLVTDSIRYDPESDSIKFKLNDGDGSWYVISIEISIINDFFETPDLADEALESVSDHEAEFETLANALIDNQEYEFEPQGVINYIDRITMYSEFKY
jgi:hypothetical protein